MRGKRFHVIYPSWIPLAGLKEFLEEKIGHDVVKMRAHWEVADNENAHEHTHVCFELKEPIDLDGERRLDFGEPAQHPNIKPIRYESHFKNTWEYVWKDHDKENMESYQFGNLIETDEKKKQELNNLRDIIQRYDSWGKVVNDPDITVHVARHHKICYDWWLARPNRACHEVQDEDLTEWQKEIIKETEEGTQSTLILSSQEMDCSMGIRSEGRKRKEHAVPIHDEQVCCFF